MLMCFTCSQRPLKRCFSNTTHPSLLQHQSNASFRTAEFSAASAWFPAASADIYVELVPDFGAASQSFQWTASRVWSSSSRFSSLWNCWLSQRFPSSRTTSTSTSLAVTGTRNGGETQNWVLCVWTLWLPQQQPS